MGVLMEFQGFSKKCKGCFKEASMAVQRSFKGVSRKFQGCFEGASISLFFAYLFFRLLS